MGEGCSGQKQVTLSLFPGTRTPGAAWPSLREWEACGLLLVWVALWRFRQSLEREVSSLLSLHAEPFVIEKPWSIRECHPGPLAASQNPAPGRMREKSLELLSAAMRVL